MALEWKPFIPTETRALNRAQLHANETIISLPLPPLLGTPLEYGTYVRSPYFKQVLAFYFASTTEKGALGEFLRKEILPTLSATDRLLDVGCGDGRITRKIAPFFRHATLVDSDSGVFKNGSPSGRETDTRVNAKFPSAPLGPFPFDLVLLSHMLYYSNPSEWPKIVYSAFNRLSIQGAAAVVWQGDEGQHTEMIRHFGGKHPQIEPLVAACRTLFTPEQVELFSIPTIQRTSDLEGMTHIAGFYLMDSGSQIPPPQVRDYVEAHFKQEDGTYQMEHPDRVIVVRRPEVSSGAPSPQV